MINGALGALGALAKGFAGGLAKRLEKDFAKGFEPHQQVSRVKGPARIRIYIYIYMNIRYTKITKMYKI